MSFPLPPPLPSRRAFLAALAGIAAIGRSTLTQAAQKAPEADPLVIITRTGERYHRANCRTLRASRIEVKKSEAIAKGYTPCQVCKPT